MCFVLECTPEDIIRYVEIESIIYCKYLFP
ncbi:MAG: hypothetical protein NC118_06360 [Eubacterium sp.]|nr:hypothetical protein [Butyrivibrio sp.]MCM1426211.1 hypothetical protein [Eubacterium sp.]